MHVGAVRACVRSVMSYAETQFHALLNPPEWWRPVIVMGARCYAAERFDNAFATTNAWLLYDETSHVAHYYYIGID